MTDDGDLVAAAAITAALVVVALVADVWLVRTGRRPITHVFRLPAVRVALDYFEAHVDDQLGALDVFRVFGRLVPVRA